MKNFVQPGHVVTVPAPAAVTSGKLVIIGSLVGAAQKSAAIGEDLPLLTEGVISYAKVSALAIAVGDKLYYDTANDVVNNTLVGVAVAVSANPSPTAKFKLGATTV
jgi:predicted RecA/RadA family phage recombinase